MCSEPLPQRACCLLQHDFIWNFDGKVSAHFTVLCVGVYRGQIHHFSLEVFKRHKFGLLLLLSGYAFECSTEKKNPDP